MFKKTFIVIFTVLFLSISTFIFPESDPVTFADLVAYYPEISFEDLEDYDYILYEHGVDYYLVVISGITYIVQL